MRYSRIFATLCALALGALAQQTSAPGEPLGELFASDATLKGSVVLAGGGMQVMSGAQVTAGKSAALLRLTRGGEVRVCSATALQVAASSSGRELMLSMSSGAVEAHYPLGPTADSIMTPDFRIMLVGPGEFHFAIGADPRGNTCIKALENNTASLIVSELLGDSAYQVKPRERVYFRQGRLSQSSVEEADECGCPAPTTPVLRAQAEPQANPMDAVPALPLSASAPPPTTALPDSAPGEVHVQIDAPFVFRGDQLPATPLAVPPPPELVARESIAGLGAEVPMPGALLIPEPSQNVPQPAAAAAAPKKPRKGFFGKLGSFFASIFKG